MKTTEISSNEDLLDVRDIIARVEELETEVEDTDNEDAGEQREELKSLTELLSELKGCGGSEQWRGDWYPITLVADSYFEDFARQEAEDCGLIKNDISWPYTCIDWEKAADELKMDYTTVDFGGNTFWYR